jgi:DegV family protein with EDD domain
MPGVRIVTDSSCDLTSQEADDLDIEIVPLTIRFGSEEYTDRQNLSVDDFYKKMAAYDALPETAAPAPGAFEQAFRNTVESGADGIVCLNISSGLSATMQSALAAAQAFGDRPSGGERGGRVPVRVIDSRSITSGLGTQVLLAARAARDGRDLDGVTALVEDLIARTRVFATIDTLENLKKGGRIGGAQAFVGSLLSIKPLVEVSSGSVQEAGKARTRRKAFAWLLDRMRADGAIEQPVAVHSAASDFSDFLDLVTADYPAVRAGEIGPVIGTHAGAGVVGCTWLVPTR